MHSITQFYSRAATNHACRRTKESFDLVSVKWMQAQRGELKQQQSSSMSKVVLEFQVHYRKKHSRVIIYSGAPLRSATNFKNVRPPYQCTVQRCRCSVRSTFQHWNISTWGFFGARNLQHEDISAQEHFCTGRFLHVEILAQ